MEIYPNQYYHLYNRSINNELLFKSTENYIYFLKKYRHHLEQLMDTYAYCLMPTHFHFLIFVKSDDIFQIQKNIGILLSSYCKAINKKYNRHGSIFQRHSKAKLIPEEFYLLAVISYIHQNPLHSNLVNNIEDWEYSSYPDYIGKRGGTLPNKELLKKHFASVEEFIEFSKKQTDLPDYLV
jgi:putative transposase